jgi:hypothetical protein
MSTEASDRAMARGVLRTDLGRRLRWFVVSIPVYAFWGAVSGAMGEVVGEAWGGAFLHQLGHAIGTVLLLWALLGTFWLVLRRRFAWAATFARTGAVGAFIGIAVYVPVLWLAPDSLEELTIAGTLYLPLAGAAVGQLRALRGKVEGAGRWVAAWTFAIVLGIAIAWYAGGGLTGAAAGWPFPVLEKAVAYWWRILPQQVLGAVAFAAWTALAVPLHRAR